ncbi:MULTISPECIES: PLP-dependent cysteine synthase family protein [Staphylococcus]|uniref:PLP-dependent cysteine synthase family protein n=1 Tax=Staphylococcus TaxID=1279 RepID=UPI0002D88C96|nr:MULTISPECIES: cysteine synthase family protein [Staphylococcus]MBL3398664.1 cysteine synthase family protein [Staphylococcus pasteuri]MBM6506329.1 cysteine synthase family protein [Staphylococcus pasteuri]MCT1927454.1 cysteine synthase family protein [Staphylococcus pasteuri]MEB6612421.1 cysteine synthase family protein [Staphylococcus pasteuri]PTU81275.1 cysteine synthase family protein [Staphylococcus pasteuri]
MIAYDLIGQTPLVLLESYSDENVKIYAKLEQFNPGGSVKDRLGKYLVEQAIEEGRLQRGDTIVEATAGNTGIGLAIAANRYDLKCVIFAPEGFSEEKISIMRALGADVKRTAKDEGMIGAQQVAKQYATDTQSIYMNQFETKHNPDAYTHTLGKELTDELNHIDYFVAGAGSGGTFTGVARHLQPLGVKSYIVEPEGSILNGGPSHAHDTEGIGSEKWPGFLEKTLVDGIFTISDKHAFENVKNIAKNEGLLVGSSSGAALQGALELKQQLDKGVIVTIFPDGSDRYMSKQIFNYKEMDDNE